MKLKINVIKQNVYGFDTGLLYRTVPDFFSVVGETSLRAVALLFPGLPSSALGCVIHSRLQRNLAKDSNCNTTLFKTSTN